MAGFFENHRFQSGELTLAAHLARPLGRGAGRNSGAGPVEEFQVS
ncbi:MAG: hypothetical protein Ct9H300mP12_12830 [Acidimicrobiales bacterium]|nr:MAG: hypothetical protein Ct9H300mP12_12830 [Acidimicrobiales bacterium]